VSVYVCVCGCWRYYRQMSMKTVVSRASAGLGVCGEVGLCMGFFEFLCLGFWLLAQCSKIDVPLADVGVGVGGSEGVGVGEWAVSLSVGRCGNSMCMCIYLHVYVCICLLLLYVYVYSCTFMCMYTYA